MDKQTKINILKDYIEIKQKNSSHLTLINSKLYEESKNWLQELEQSNNKSSFDKLAEEITEEDKIEVRACIESIINNKDNIDNWSNRELFDYCVENELIGKNYLFNDFDDINSRNWFIRLIAYFKSQK